MSTTPSHSEASQLQFSIPWDSNTVRGFVGSVILNAIVLFLMQYVDVSVVERKEERRTIPLELINFGMGDGSGISSGNLAERGETRRGADQPNILEDARPAARLKRVTAENPSEYTPGATPIPTERLSSDRPPKNQHDEGDSRRDLGEKDGSDNGTGLSPWGSGIGKGAGLGEIEWGGGGNRQVIHKILPTYPRGLRTSALIKIRFTVNADGTVGSMIPLVKGHPAMERAAMNALRQWRFNPLPDGKKMSGIIPFSFRIE